MRVAELKELCEDTNVEYGKIKSYVVTRLLSLKPALEQLIKLYLPLKKYFSTIEKPPAILKEYFRSEETLLWLHFLLSIAILFSNTITAIEGEEISFVESFSKLEFLKGIIQNRKNITFLPTEVNKIIKEKKLNLLKIQKIADSFYQNCLDYIEKWNQNQNLKSFKWGLLCSNMNIEDVIKSRNFIVNNYPEIHIEEGILVDEFFYLKTFIESKIDNWNLKNFSTLARWKEVFEWQKECIELKFENIKIIVQFFLTLPGTNASTERVFSVMNNVWTDAKSQLSVETLKNILITKINFNYNCAEFSQILKNNKKLLECIHSSDKYKKQ